MKKTFTFLFATFILCCYAQVSVQTFSLAGNFVYTVPSGVTSLTIEAVGAGGKGITNGGGGGGGGGYASGIYTVTPGSTLSIKVGTPNISQVAGTSSVTGFLIATGGANGTSLNTNTVIGGSGPGGAGSGGNIANRTGGNGGDGCWTYFGAGGGGAGGATGNGGNGGNTPVYNGSNCATPGGTAGVSGGSPGGNGGNGSGFSNSSCSASIPATNPTIFGGGGGSGNGIGSPPTNGSGGMVRISWTASCTPPPAPSGSSNSTNLVICSNNTTSIFATSNFSVTWYATATSTTALASGTVFSTPTLTTGITYYAQATNTCSGSTRTAITITVNPTPTITAMANPTLICSGQSSTLNASGANSYSYNPAIPMSGVVSPTASTSYSVIGTSTANCNSSISVLSLSVQNCTGINDFIISKKIHLYPNPSSEKITITGDLKNITLKFFDITGKQVLTNNFTNSTTININSLPTGLYLIKAEENNVFIETIKFIKQ